jgi:acyl carrier protein
MNRDQVKAVVLKHIAAIVEWLPVEAIDPSRSMRDYRVNSLDVVEIVSRSMRELKVKVPRAELRRLTNIDGLIDLLHHMTQAPPPPVSAPVTTGQTTPPS